MCRHTLGPVFDSFSYWRCLSRWTWYRMCLLPHYSGLKDKTRRLGVPRLALDMDTLSYLCLDCVLVCFHTNAGCMAHCKLVLSTTGLVSLHADCCLDLQSGALRKYPASTVHRGRTSGVLLCFACMVLKLLFGITEGIPLK